MPPPAGAPPAPNLVARLAGRRGGPALLLEAHMDTVPAVVGQVGPFTPRIEDGRLHGRGACDCKGAMAAMVEALLRVARQGERPDHDVWFLGTVDEEHAHTGIDALVRERVRGAAAVVAAVAIYERALRAGIGSGP